MQGEHSLGAVLLPDGRCSFRVWAPLVNRVELKLLGPAGRVIPLARDADGYHSAVVADVTPGAEYVFTLNRLHERPDPASRCQPHGVHGPSAVVDTRFPWSDAGWHGLPLEDYVIYELHVGTYTHEGTFEAIVPHLDRLRDLGVTAIELMPVAQFPGSRNWGYDGVYPFAAQNSYGGPDGLRTLVDACHSRGLAVILDVVYNHLGPEGNYLSDFGPYFTDRFSTPWGKALNFDDRSSDEVRRYFIENALWWITDCHIDALRLDAVHAILDLSAEHLLEELARRVDARARRLNRQVHLIAESDLNDPRLIRTREMGGYGLDAQWSDDFHHSLHALLTAEDSGYYSDFGKVEHLARAIRNGFVYAGGHSAFRGRKHGREAAGIPGERFVICAQNHDQVGNRMLGDRLTRLASFEELKLAAAAVILSPFVPLLFMGEEYGETAPFPYFISHSDPGLIEAVRAGRREEFSGFRWAGEPPDPQSLATFESAILDHGRRGRGNHARLLEFYRELLQLRRTHTALRELDRTRMEVWHTELSEGAPFHPEILKPPRIGEEHQDPALFNYRRGLVVRRWSDHEEMVMLFHFGDGAATFADAAPLPAGRWQKLIESSDAKWGGEGAGLPEQLDSTGRVELTYPAQCFALYRRDR